MKHSIFILILIFNVLSSINAQDETSIELTPQQQKELQQIISSKIRDLSSIIDILTSHDERITRDRKLTEINKGYYLFYDYDSRNIYITSERFPHGQKRRIRNYFYNLIRLSQRYYIQIKWSDVIIPMNKKSIFRFIGYTPTGDMIYQGKAFLKQVFIEYSSEALSNKEVTLPTVILNDIDQKSIDIKITVAQHEINGKWHSFYNVKLGDIHATLLQHKTT